MREPSERRTWWKLTSFSSVAEYSFTPMLTSPNDTVPFQIERIGSPSDVNPASVSDGMGEAYPLKYPEWRGAPHAGNFDSRAAPRPGVGLRVQVGRGAGPARRGRRSGADP